MLSQIKSQWFTDKEQYKFCRLLAEACPDKRFSEAMRSWLRITSLCFQQKVNIFIRGEESQDIEDKYSAEIKSVKNPSKFSEALAVMINHQSNGITDFLGEVFSLMGAYNAGVGQFFTPFALSNICAGLSLGKDPTSMLEDKDLGVLTLSEPASGSGGMCLAAVRHFREHKVGDDKFHFTCVDVDQRCVDMTYIQLTLHGIAATVIHGNTLSLQEYSKAETIGTFLHRINTKLILQDTRNSRTKTKAHRKRTR